MSSFFHNARNNCCITWLCLVVLLSGSAGTLAGQNSLNLPPGTSYSQDFSSSPGATGTTLPIGWAIADGNNPTDTLLIGDENSTEAGAYNFGEAVGWIGTDDAYNPGYLYLRLSNTVLREQFRLDFTVTNVADNFLTAAEIALEISTDEGNSWQTVSGVSYNSLTNGDSLTFEEVALPVALDNQSQPVWLRWVYTPQISFGGFGDGLSIDDVTLNWTDQSFSLELGPDQQICAGSSVTLDATLAGASYIWSTGDTTPTITVDSAGTYAVTVTAGTGATASDTVEVSLLPAPLGAAYTTDPATEGTHNNGTLNNPDFICPGNRMRYAISAPAGFADDSLGQTWAIGQPIVRDIGAGLFFNGALSLDTTVRPVVFQLEPLPGDGGRIFRMRLPVVDLNSGCTDTIERFLFVDAAPIPPNLENDVRLCAPGSPFTLDASVSDPAVSYQWSTGVQVPEVTVSDTGTFFVTLTNAQGCSYTDTSVVTLESWRPTLGPDTTVCGNLPIDISYTGPNPSQASYLWQDGSTQPERNLTQPALYFVEGVTPFGCSFRDTLQLGVLPLPFSGLPAQATICPGDTFVANTNNFQDVHTWSDGFAQPVRALTTPGLYWVSINDGQCSRTDTLQLEQLPTPTVNLGPDRSACDSLTLDAGAGPAAYYWSLGDTAQTFTVQVSGTYSVQVTNPEGCSAADTVTITLEEPFSLGLSAQDTLVNTGEYLGFTAENDLPDSVSAEWLWDFGNETFSTLADSLTYRYPAPGTYTVTLTVATAVCEQTRQITITVQEAVGRGQASTAQPLNIYPNPSSGHLTLSGLPYTESFTAEVYNLQGKRVWNKTFAGHRAVYNLHLPPTLPAGAYLLQLAPKTPGKGATAAELIFRERILLLSR